MVVVVVASRAGGGGGGGDRGRTKKAAACLCARSSAPDVTPSRNPLRSFVMDALCLRFCVYAEARTDAVNSALVKASFMRAPVVRWECERHTREAVAQVANAPWKAWAARFFPHMPQGSLPSFA